MHRNRYFRTGQSLLFALLFIAPSISLFARPHGPFKDGPPTEKHEERMLQHMKRQLDLTDVQVKKIEEIQKKYSGKADEIRKKMQPLRKELRESMFASSPERSKVEATMRKLADLRLEMQLIFFDRHQEVDAVLTETQRAKMKKDMKDHIEKRMSDRRDHRGWHGKGRCDDEDNDD